MRTLKIFCVILVSVLSVFATASPPDNHLIEQQVRIFLDDYLSVYNRRLGHADRGVQFRSEISDLVHVPLLFSSPAGKPHVFQTAEEFSKNFEGFVVSLEKKGVTRLEWQQVQFRILSPNKVIVNNIGQGVTSNGDVAYETISIYLLSRYDDEWRIVMFSPYLIDNAINL